MKLLWKNDFMLAKDIAEEVDANPHRIARICKKLDEDKGLIEREKRMAHCINIKF